MSLDGLIEHLLQVSKCYGLLLNYSQCEVERPEGLSTE